MFSLEAEVLMTSLPLETVGTSGEALLNRVQNGQAVFGRSPEEASYTELKTVPGVWAEDLPETKETSKATPVTRRTRNRVHRGHFDIILTPVFLTSVFSTS
jgi:hypothetical protein